MTLDPKVEKKMVGAVMPWLKNFHHMRVVDKESAVREALKYAIQIYELHRETAAPDLLEALNQILRPYGVADVGMNNAPAPLQIEFIEAVQKARAAAAKATGV